MTYSTILIAFLISCISIPLLKKTSVKFHCYDEPSGDTLKVHKKPIPYKN